MIVFRKKLAAARASEIITYARDRSLKGEPAGTQALAAYFRGEVELVHRRSGKVFAYLAVKCREVIPPHIADGMLGKVQTILKESSA